MGSRMAYAKRATSANPLEKRWGANPKGEKVKVYEIATSKVAFMSALNYLIIRAKKDKRIGEIVTFKGLKFKLYEDDTAEKVLKRYMRIIGYDEVKFKK